MVNPSCMMLNTIFNMQCVHVPKSCQIEKHNIHYSRNDLSERIQTEIRRRITQLITYFKMNSKKSIHIRPWSFYKPRRRCYFKKSVTVITRLNPIGVYATSKKYHGTLQDVELSISPLNAPIYWACDSSGATGKWCVMSSPEHRYQQAISHQSPEIDPWVNSLLQPETHQTQGIASNLIVSC